MIVPAADAALAVAYSPACTLNFWVQVVFLHVSQSGTSFKMEILKELFINFVCDNWAP